MRSMVLEIPKTPNGVTHTLAAIDSIFLINLVLVSVLRVALSTTSNER